MIFIDPQSTNTHVQSTANADTGTGDRIQSLVEFRMSKQDSHNGSHYYTSDTNTIAKYLSEAR